MAYTNRFKRHPGGAVPQNPEGRTPEQQLAYLDEKGFVAKKERAKLAQRIIKAREPAVLLSPKQAADLKVALGAKAPAPTDGSKMSKYQARQARREQE